MEAEAESRVAPRPGLVLAILAFGGCAFSMLQSLVVPALPALQHELDTTPTGVDVDLHDLSPRRLGCDADRRPLRRHVREEARAARRARRARRRDRCSLRSPRACRVLIVARTIQGVGGAIFPLAFGIIRDEFPRERVPGGIGLISGLLGIGGGLGIVLAGPILTHLDYHWLFWIPLVVVVVDDGRDLVVLIPESPRSRARPVDWPGAVLLTVWLVCLLLAISEAPTLGLDAPRDDRAARARGRARDRLGRGRAALAEPARRHAR